MTQKRTYGKPTIKNIQAIIEENDTTKTFFISNNGFKAAYAGQFLMVWQPGVDEKPISISIIDKQQNWIGLTIKKVGPTTQAMHDNQIGSKIGVRGPFGTGFKIFPNEEVILIAGGIGIAPIRCLFDRYVTLKSPKKITLIYGATSKQELIFREHFFQTSQQDRITVEYCTDDGSYGFEGFPTQKLALLLEKRDKTPMIYGCGPEIFLKAVLNMTKKHGLLKNTYLSLADRYMRCGVGLCSSCVLDGVGLTVCKDGPVFSGEVLDHVEDFGTYARKKDGSKYFLPH